MKRKNGLIIFLDILIVGNIPLDQTKLIKEL